MKYKNLKKCLKILIVFTLIIPSIIPFKPSVNNHDSKINLRISQEHEPIGIIALWSDPLVTIPEGWKLLDGTNSSIDPTDRFLCSTNGTEDAGSVGGNLSHHHGYSEVPYHDHGYTITTVNSHSHSYSDVQTTVRVTDSGMAWPHIPGTSYTNDAINDHTHDVQSTGGINLNMSEENHLPPYYKLAFIEKETDSNIIPIGLIVMWAGLIEDIPEGWIICDGTNSTPDLRQRFIRGVSQDEDPGAIGGNFIHNHSYTEIPIHTHSLAYTQESHNHGYGVEVSDGLGGGSEVWLPNKHELTTNPTTITHTHTINEVGITTCITNNSNNLPPYYKIAFIMNAELCFELPSGIITMWGNTTMNIPLGWRQANGDNGSPNLSERFPFGINTGEQPGTIGGSTSHDHIYTDIPRHSHIVENNVWSHTHNIYRYAGASVGATTNPSGVWAMSRSTTNLISTQTASPSHNHDVNPTGTTNPHTTLDTALPPYIKLNFIQKEIKDNTPSDNGTPTDFQLDPFIFVPIGIVVVVSTGIIYIKRKRI